MPATMSVARLCNPVSLLNLFLLPAFIVDATTGAISNYTDSMSVDLQEQAPTVQTPVAHTGSGRSAMRAVQARSRRAACAG